MKSKLVCLRAIFILAMLAVAAGRQSLYALSNFNWTGGTADYSVGADWGGTVPTGSINDSATVANGGTINFTGSDNYFIGQLNLAPSNNNTATFHMTGGTLLISNNDTQISMFLGGWGSGTSTSPNTGNNSSGTFILGGGSLTVARNESGQFFRDGLDLGVGTNATGTLTVSNGTMTVLCGIELGIYGTGVINLYGGTLIDNSWFGIGRGPSSAIGSGIVNITNGTLYLLRNSNDEGNDTRGFYFCDYGIYGLANLSGGTVYCNRMGFANNSSATELLNISGGTIYMGSDGVSASSAQAVVNISGGVFHTVNMVTNGTGITLNGNPYTVGDGDTNAVLPGGTNWTWSTYPSVNLTNSIPGMGGVGYVSFAPEAGETITLDNTWFGHGGLTVNGPGIVAMGASNTYSGNTTVTQGTLVIVAPGSIASPNIIVAPGATFAGPGSGSSFVLGAGQTLSNSGTGAMLGGTLNLGSGNLVLTCPSGTPAFTVVGGTFGMSSGATVQVNNTGPPLGTGNYLIVSGGGGSVTVPDGLPPVTVTGGGVTAGTLPFLTASNNSLYLTISTNRPPIVANALTNYLFYGSTYQISLSNLAVMAGWSDPDGEAIGLSAVGPTSANGTNISTDGTNIYYDGTLTSTDYFNYTITNSSLSAVGTIYLNEIEPTAMIPADAGDVVSLDGSWRFYFERSNYDLGTAPNVVLPPASQPFQQTNYVEVPGWTNLAVPGNWEMAGLSPCTYYVPDDTCGLYRDWIQVPQSWQGRRVYLNLDGVLDGAEVWLNGQPVPVNEPSWNILNYHESAWTAFQVDLTSQVQFGTSNLLAIRVIKSTPSDDLDTGDYFMLGGIYRSVTMYSVPQTNFASMQVQTTLLPNNRAQVQVTANVTGGPASVALFLNGVETDTTATNGQAVFTQIISQAKLWSCEFPNLYPLLLELKSPGGAVSETITNHVGIRQITITNGVLLINGVPVKFAGIGDHDASPTLGTAVDSNFWRRDILMMKAANINAIRTTHYPFDSHLYDLCDELGMYVSDELPYCWCDPEVGESSMQPAFEQRARETIRRDINHPCVVIWAIGNENSAGNNLQVVANLIPTMDATRPRLVSTFNASQYGVELSDSHYPSINAMVSDANNAASTGHPFIFLENPNTWDERLGADPGMWEDWGLCMQRCWNVCQEYATIPGTFPFEWSDRAVQDPNSNASYTEYESTGVQLLYYFPATGVHLLKMKGTVDAFRDERPNVYELQMIYSPVQVTNPFSVAPGVVSFPLQNRYSFTDLSNVTTLWQLQRAGQVIASGATNISQPPLTSATVQLFMPSNALSYADTLRLDFIDVNTNDIYAYQYALASPAAPTGLSTTLPASLPIPSLNLIAYNLYSDPGYWTECKRYPASLTNIVLTPSGATPLAQMTAMSATVLAEGGQTLGQVQAGFTNNVFSYTINWTGPTTNILELGWGFQMPSNCLNFSWNRQGRWTAYPETDICRALGTATPETTNTDVTEMDIPNAFDFNSTKYNCNWASLTAADGSGLRLQFNGSQLFHCSAGGAAGGNGYVLYANQEVSPASDISSNVVPDLFMTLKNGSVVKGSFTVGSSTNFVSSATGSLSGPISVLYTSGSGGSGGSGNEGFQLNFTGAPNTGYSIWESTNLFDWQWEGAATQENSGQYQFFDPSATNAPARFYRLTSP